MLAQRLVYEVAVRLWVVILVLDQFYLKKGHTAVTSGEGRLLLVHLV